MFYILDLDNVLLNIDASKLDMEKQLSEWGIQPSDFQASYERHRNPGTHAVDVSGLIQKWSKEYPKLDFNDLFFVDYTVYLMEGSLSFLHALQERGELKICTQGYPRLQEQKMQTSGIQELVGEGNIYCCAIDKLSTIVELAGKAKEKGSGFVYVDDNPKVLQRLSEALRENNLSARLIWFRYGTHANDPEGRGLQAEQVGNISELKETLLKNGREG